MNRREFLRRTGLLVVSVFTGCIPKPEQRKRFGMLIDMGKCKRGCTICIDVCREENNVPLFGNPKIDAHWIRKAKRKNGKEIILLCNHCERPSCVRVCPVKASFKREDGIVLIDMHRCIGCRYCMIACPYKARSFVFAHTEWKNKERTKRAHGVVEKCTFCVHRVDEGKFPICVKSCPEDAMVFGDISSAPLSDQIVDAMTLRPELGTRPKVYYLGL
jgi:molybdopterin-containing oxidoreductase family iron-sulfur binding subunit